MLAVRPKDKVLRQARPCASSLHALQRLLRDTSCKAAKAEHKQVSQALHKQLTQNSGYHKADYQAD